MITARNLLLYLFYLLPLHTYGQSYADSLTRDREAYKAGLMQGTHGLKASDTGYVRFYDFDPSYRVNAVFVPTFGARPFPMATMHGGVSPSVKEYGIVYFNLKGAAVTMRIYRLMTRPEDNTDESIRLFIPFTDNTNYVETFGGGRYLDISAYDIQDNKVVLDFNKCYNPHTAYEKGFPYIIPPKANYLRIEIKAGEKIFGHNPGY